MMSDWALVHTNFEKKYTYVNTWIWIFLQTLIILIFIVLKIYPFSKGSFQPRDQNQVSWTVGRFFTIWAIKKLI